MHTALVNSGFFCTAAGVSSHRHPTNRGGFAQAKVNRRKKCQVWLAGLWCFLFCLLVNAAAQADPLTPGERARHREHGPFGYATHDSSPSSEFWGLRHLAIGVTPEVIRVLAANLGLNPWRNPALMAQQNPLPVWFRRIIYTLAALALVLAVRIYMLNRKLVSQTRQLQASEQSFRTFFDGARDAHLVADPDTELILDANQAATELWRCPKEKLVGRHQTLLFAPEERDRANTGFRTKKDTDLVEILALSDDGRRIPVEISGTPVILADGRRVIHGAFRDITQRKRVEQASAHQERLLMIVAQSSPDLIFVYDPEKGCRIYSNRDPLKSLGYSEAESRLLEGKEVPELMHPDDLPRFQAHIEAVRTAGDHTVMDFEYRMRRNDGGYAWLLSRDTVFQRDAQGRATQILNVTQDITARKETELALAEKEKFLAAIVNHTPDHIVVFDLEKRRAVYRNKSLPLCYSPEELDIVQESDFVRLLHLEDLPRYHRHMERLANHDHEKIEDFEYRLQCKDGSWAWFLGHDSVFRRNATGQVTQILSVSQDITQQKLIEAQVRQAQKMEAVGRLAGGVAHDFNNILTAQLMNLQLLLQERDVPLQVQAGLTEMEAQARRASALIRQLLLFGRRQPMNLQALDLNLLVGSLLKMLNRLIGTHITVDFRAVSQPLWIQADLSMIDQVVTNLVLNARDAMPNGGRLMLRTQSILIDPAHVTAHPQARTGTFIRLSVEDTGCGMDEAILKRIFEPFFTTKPAGKGTGLGLSTVYSVVDQHQGWIEVESVVGKGSRLQVYLPTQETPAPKSTSPPAPQPPPRDAETILVVEDESAVRQLIVRSLQNHGFRVHQAEHGPEAVQVWEKHGCSVDLLLTDLMMPGGIGGLDLAERLQKLKPALKVIFISGYSAEMTTPNSAMPPGTCFLQKPFVPEDLVHTVRRLLEGAKIRPPQNPEAG